MFSWEYCKIFKNIYFEDHLQVTASACGSILYKEFVDIAYDNASFDILEGAMWLQFIYFFQNFKIAFWPMKHVFRILCVL